MSGARKLKAMDTDSLSAISAKDVEERRYGMDGCETRRGTKHFRPGAKVFVIDAFWGMYDAVTVIGHHRVSWRYSKLSMSVAHLEAFRTDRVYSPKVINLIREHFDGDNRYDEDHLSELLMVLPIWKNALVEE